MRQAIALVFILLTLGIAVAQVTPAMKAEFVKAHNDFRQKVKSCGVKGQPGAKVMPNLKWNDQLAAKAQVLANQCRVGHDTSSQRRIPAYPYVGQNWAGTRTISKGMELWFDEARDYKFDSNTCSRMCGHYTQAVWANTKEVGCGVKKCGGSYPYGLSIVCNYGPAGNMNRARPYEKKTC